MDFLLFLLTVLQENPGASIALFALLMTFYQAYLSRKHNRLSVRPHLTVFSDFQCVDNVFTWEVNLRNCGLGPAIINSYTVFTDQFSIAEDSSIQDGIDNLADLVRKHFSMDYEPDSRFAFYKEGAVLSANETSNVAAIVFKIRDRTHLAEIRSKIPLIHLKVVYESAYEEKFVYNTDRHMKKASINLFLRGLIPFSIRY